MRIKADGHANYDAHGHDLVCASFSLLGQSLISWIQEQAQLGSVIGAGRVQWDRGLIDIDVALHPAMEAAARGALDVVWHGICLLAKNFPEYLEIGENDFYPLCTIDA